MSADVFSLRSSGAHRFGRVEKAHRGTDLLDWCGWSPEAEVITCCVASFQKFPEQRPIS